MEHSDLLTWIVSGNVIGTYNLEVFSQKGDICWTYTMGNNEEIPDGMGQSIWSWIVGNGGHHFPTGSKKLTDAECPTRGP